MTPQLARAMDDLGLTMLVDQFMAKVHHFPDLTRLSEFSGAARFDYRALHPEPARLELTLDPEERHRGYRMRRFAGTTPVFTPFEEDRLLHGNLFAPLDQEGHGTVLIAHGGLTGLQPRGADLRPYLKWAQDLTRAGLNVMLPALPRHFERAPRGTFSGERFLSGNLLETIEAIAQATQELEALVHWLLEHGFGPIGVLGMSLGGLTSIQLLRVEDQLQAALLLAPVPDASRSIFESAIGRSIRRDWMQGGATRADLDAVFAPLSPGGGGPCIPPERIRLAAGAFDEVVKPSEVQRMAAQWGVEAWEVPEGHLGLIASTELRRLGTPFFFEHLGVPGSPAGLEERSAHSQNEATDL